MLGGYEWWLPLILKIASIALKTINIGGKSCKNDCSGQGICNRELGQYSCFHGFCGCRSKEEEKELCYCNSNGRSMVVPVGGCHSGHCCRAGFKNSEKAC